MGDPLSFERRSVEFLLERARQERLAVISAFFDIEFQLQELDKAGDPLIKLKEEVDWEDFRDEFESIRNEESKSNAGRRPFDPAVMFKLLILQSLYNLGNDSVEYHIRDRISFMRFLGLPIWDKVPDANTIWLYREHIQRKGCRHKPLSEWEKQGTARDPKYGRG